MIPNPKIDASAFIAPDAVIKGNVTIGANCSIWFHSVVRADHSIITIGNNSNIQDNCVVHVDPWTNVHIGEGVTVGHSAIIHGCTIGDNTIIGMGSIIMNNAVVGKNCIIGAGALVTENKVIPDGSLVIGSPAKVIRSLTDDEIEKNRMNAAHYIHIGQEYKEQ